MLRRAIIVGLLGLSVASLASSGAAAVPRVTVQSDSEVAADAAAAYSEVTGVSVETAAKELVLQGQVAETLAKLSADHGEVFAGAWIEHTPTMKTVVRLTLGADNETMGLIRRSVPGDVDVRRDAVIPLATLKATVLEANKRLSTALRSGRATTGIDLEDNQVHVWFARDLSDTDREGLVESVRGLAGLTTGVAPVTLLGGEDAVHGGGRLSNGTSVCTTGFVVKDRTTGTRGVVTAGHCANNMNYTTGTVQNLVFQREYNAYWGDVQFHTGASGVTFEPRFYVGPSSLRTLTDWKNSSFITQGMVLCAYGRSTNIQKCDTVYKVGNWCAGNDFMVLMTNRKLMDGDSGGPWYSSSVAYGVHKGHTWNLGDRDCFSTMDVLWSPLSVEPVRG